MQSIKMSDVLVMQRIQRGPSLKIVLQYRSRDYNGEAISEEINIDDMAKVRFQFKKESNFNSTPLNTVSISSAKHKLANESTIKMNITCKELDYSKQITCSDGWINWKIMGRAKSVERSSSVGSGLDIGFVIEVTMYVYKVETAGFANLYEDTDLTDFYLRTEDGGVGLHKICLAAYSDVFKTMLTGPWKEAEEDCVKIKDVSVQTLQHLKSYIYLRTLPEDRELRPLLVLAARYFIDDLKVQCARKLALTVLPENLHSLHALACENNIPELSIAISQLTPDAVVHCAYEMQKKGADVKQAEKE